jgi:hypothetical protein
MVRYKMLARDINSNPTQYRTWIVANNPDLGVEYYYGYKSGYNDFVDVSAYSIEDNSVIANFNLPLPGQWTPPPPSEILEFLPFPLEDSHFAIVDGYAYMFGGKITDHIYQASLDNPATWTDTGAHLPTPLYGGSLAIVDGVIYIFGGNTGENNPTNTIFSAPVSNPLYWTNQGNLFPDNLCYSSLVMLDSPGGPVLLMYGGLNDSGATSNYYFTPTSNPVLGWSNGGPVLPTPVYGSTIAQINGQIILYGGMLNAGVQSDLIWTTATNNLITWSEVGVLPYPTAFNQMITIGNDGYIIGPMVGVTNGFTSILHFPLNAPFSVVDTGHIVRGVISHSQIAIIYDRIWLFGGSGSTSIFACNQQLKYNYYNSIVQTYADFTRLIFPATDNLGNPFQALGFPYWRTDYSMSSPPPAPPVPPPPPPVYPPFPPTTPTPPYF